MIKYQVWFVITNENETLREVQEKIDIDRDEYQRLFEELREKDKT